MKIAVFYFSGTGNTLFACEKLKAHFMASAHEITLYNIEQFNDTESAKIGDIVEGCDVVGLSYPVYGANLPKIIDRFLNIPGFYSPELKRIFILSTVGFINAYGPFIIGKRLQKKGFRLKWHYVYGTLNNTVVRKANDAQREEKHEKQEKRFKKFCDAVINDTRYIGGAGPWIIGGYIVRNILKKPILEHYKHFYIDEDACIKCGICERDCPTGTIKISEGAAAFHEGCTTCFRCINRCPVGAIKER